jgi:hypothetical protein
MMNTENAISPTDPLVECATRSYANTMLWANAVCDVEDCADREAGGDCEHTNDAIADHGWDDFNADDQTSMAADVYDLILANVDDFFAYVVARSADNFGHDFALTRNGHGAGFWDRGLGELGDRLTTAAKVYGESSVYVNDGGVTLS